MYVGLVKFKFIIITGLLKKTGLVINDAYQNDNLLLLVNYQENSESSKSEDFFWISSRQLGAY